VSGARLLLVEDDPDIAAVLRRGLAAEGFAVDHAATTAAALALLEEATYPLVVIDRILPDGDGVDLCRVLRERGNGALILLLTARDAIADRVEGLKAGADDYLTKPFAFEELLARIEALERRASGPALGATTASLQVADLMLDPDTKTARRGEREITLTATEYALLAYLMSRAGRVASRADILREVWGYGFDPGTNIVEVYVAYLRRKVDAGAVAPLIRTVRGFGYRLG
jgi:two-component system, OmpR family, response regulator